MSQFDDMQEKEYFECSCGDMDHILRMCYFKDELDTMYVDVHLRQKIWYRRLWQAIKYVFGHRSTFGDFDEFLWNKKEATRVRSLLDKFIEAADEQEKKEK